jgi:hypothetical protein
VVAVVGTALLSLADIDRFCQVGVELLHRTTHEFELTDAGEFRAGAVLSGS